MPAQAHCRECELGGPDRTEAVQPGLLLDGRYRLERTLGQGGMGAVFAARDVHLRRTVAIKIAHTHTEWAEGRFESEAAALGSIRHAHVVGVHAFGLHGSVPFFVMEFVPGSNLSQILSVYQKNKEYIPLYRGIEILRDIAHGLGSAHASGVVHGDVKPENVVIEDITGRPVLVDFGLTPSANNHTSDMVLGTPHYMAPELYWGDTESEVVEPNIQSDVYALGCVGYELLSGVVPYDAPDPNEIMTLHRDARVPFLSDLRADGNALDPLFQNALAKEARKRIRTCAAFSAGLDSATEKLRDFDRALIPSTEPPGRYEEAATGALRVMVVEDDPIFSKLLARCAQVAFAEQQIELARAKTGPAAIAGAGKRMPQLLILDYTLPEMNGVEVLSRIRAMRGGERVQVIVVSGAMGESERWRFGILGVADFLRKPADFALIVDTMAKIATRNGWLQLSS